MPDDATPQDNDPAKTQHRLLSFAEPDSLLTAFAQIANDHAIEFGMTLQVGGVLVSGTMVGGPTYFKLLNEALATAKGTNADELAARLIEGLSRASDKIYGADAPPNLITTYIHMRDVNLYDAAGNSSVSRLSLWRGRLAAVDGFFLGTLGQRPA